MLSSRFVTPVAIAGDVRSVQFLALHGARGDVRGSGSPVTTFLTVLTTTGALCKLADYRAE
jgi:hypothetical protein